LMEQHKCDMRTAAYIHALNRHAEAVVAMGTHHYFAQQDIQKITIAAMV
jgi:glutamate dehydrogenase (NADP+)